MIFQPSKKTILGPIIFTYTIGIKLIFYLEKLVKMKDQEDQSFIMYIYIIKTVIISYNKVKQIINEEDQFKQSYN